MKRTTTLAGVSIVIANPVMSPQPGSLPVSLSLLQVLTDADGKLIGHPSQQQQPAIPDDINDGVLAAINQQLDYLGLTISRKAAPDA